jgi:hypothetical protein
VIAKIQQQENAMKEATIFEAWADQLMEGTWSLPDTPEKQSRLVKLLSQDLPVGADATNATEQLFDLLGDDELFDQLQELADRDANADARQIILNRMQELDQDPDVMKVITSLNIDATAEMNPPEQTPADLEPTQEAVKDPADQTEDPEGTEEKPYPEYAQDLGSILKHAGVPAQEREAPDYEPEMDEAANPGVTPADIDGVPTEELDEASRCNMTEAGTMCEVHGLKECGIEEGWGLTAIPTAESALQGQYGHSGRMKPVAKDSTFLDRLKELSGMIRN